MFTGKNNLIYLLIFSKMIFHVPKRWRQNWTYGKHWLESKDCLPDNISSTLKQILFTGFNNVEVCLRILGTSPVKTCTSEWSFAAMKRLKTYARSTMVSERLNGIALMHAHQEIVPYIEKIIDLFSVKNRRLTFT